MDDGEGFPGFHPPDEVDLGPAGMSPLDGLEDEALVHALDYTTDRGA